MRKMCYDQGVLQAFLDNELPAKKRNAVEEHLSGCAGCRSTLQKLQNNAAYVDAAIGAYTEEIVFEGVEKAWERFNEKLVRRRRWCSLAGVLGGRHLAAAAVAVSLVGIFIMTTFVIGPGMRRETARVEAPRVEVAAPRVEKKAPRLEEPAARPVPGERDGREAGTHTDEPVAGLQRAPQGTGAPRTAVPDESQSHETEKVGEAPKAMLFAGSPHTPIDPAAVRDVSYCTAGQAAPVPVTGDEKELLVAWFNKGTDTGLRLKAAEEQTEQAVPVLRFTLTDGTVITVVYLNSEEVTVQRPEGVYSMRAPELASFLHEKGGEANEGTIDR